MSEPTPQPSDFVTLSKIFWRCAPRALHFTPLIDRRLLHLDSGWENDPYSLRQLALRGLVSGPRTRPKTR
jgi:hypothetical protein